MNDKGVVECKNNESSGEDQNGYLIRKLGQPMSSAATKTGYIYDIETGRCYDMSKADEFRAGIKLLFWSTGTPDHVLPIFIKSVSMHFQRENPLLPFLHNENVCVPETSIDDDDDGSCYSTPWYSIYQSTISWGSGTGQAINYQLGSRSHPATIPTIKQHHSNSTCILARQVFIR